MDFNEDWLALQGPREEPEGPEYGVMWAGWMSNDVEIPDKARIPCRIQTTPEGIALTIEAMGPILSLTGVALWTQKTDGIRLYRRDLPPMTLSEGSTLTLDLKLQIEDGNALGFGHILKMYGIL
jgi:hypothetical protein